MTRRLRLPLDTPDTFTLGEYIELSSQPDQPEPTSRPSTSPETERLPDLADLLKPPTWWASAACRGVGPGDFFPEHGEGPKPVARARAVCSGCAVRSDCAAAGAGERWGIWGGLTKGERDRRRRSSVA